MSLEKIEIEVDTEAVSTGHFDHDFGSYETWTQRERQMYAAGVVKGLNLAHRRPTLAGFFHKDGQEGVWERR